MILPEFADDMFEGERKYRQVQNPDGTFSFQDVTPYDQVGTEINAEIMNALVSLAGRPIFVTVPEGNSDVIVSSTKITENSILDVFIKDSEITGKITSHEEGSCTITFDSTLEASLNLVVLVKEVS